jgi:hypothetical protein
MRNGTIDDEAHKGIIDRLREARNRPLLGRQCRYSELKKLDLQTRCPNNQ